MTGRAPIWDARGAVMAATTAGSVAAPVPAGKGA